MTVGNWYKYENVKSIDSMYDEYRLGNHTGEALNMIHKIQYIVCNKTPLQNTTSTALSIVVCSIHQ